MRVYIAEKPSVARAIASTLGQSGKGDGYLETENGASCVTWCRGHLLEQAKPEDYIGGRVAANQLPVIPTEWKMAPKDKEASRQVQTIGRLLANATEVIHAGDPDREGQLLVDELLEYLKWHGTTRRLWLSAVDPQSVKKALASIKHNSELAPLFRAGLARARADWLVGMNASIALSRRVQENGAREAWSVGRVQTPTLALLVDRAAAIERFTAVDHYKVAAHLAGGIVAIWQMKEDTAGADADGRLLDRKVADELANRIQGKTATVQSFESKRGDRQAPMPYSLSSLQKTASKRFGMSANDTLKAAQSLYEAGLTTYPRTDCPYLPEEQALDAERILAALDAPEACDPNRRHNAWNTTKVTAHHGIIPTGEKPGQLAPNDSKIYALVCESYVRLFMPPEVAEVRQALFDIEGDAFGARSRVVLEPGWTKIGADDETDDADDEENGTLPELAKGQQIKCDKATIKSIRTQPPRPYTDGTLIAAMTRIDALIDDAKLKRRLRETSGLGTEATRAGMIEGLIGRGYAERSKKTIIPTARGRKLIRALRVVAPELTNPGVTAVWEDGLADIACDRLELDRFMGATLNQTNNLTDKLLAGDFSSLVPPAIPCPTCKQPLKPLLTKRKKPFFKCEACGGAWDDNKGKPGRKWTEPSESLGEGPVCPSCGESTEKRKTGKGHAYFRCVHGHGSWWDDGGVLGKQWEDKPARRAGGKK